MASTKCGTPAYMAPETLEEVPVYNHTADLWSLGCVLFEICTLKQAFSGESIKTIIDKISKGEYGPAPAAANINHLFLLRETIPKLLKMDQKKRIGADTILLR